ncbi:MAG TPA: nucleotide sugar dehydrogenase [Gammaproteobacteria bacterium]|nr:nucleotide sugar dehydrogenase [Gammaproteobacteria bacterium]
MLTLEECRVGLIGLGYVGLPLAVEFGKHFPTLGFDLKPERVQELREGWDRTLEVDAAELACATRLRYSDDPSELVDCNVYVVTVPTPIDRHKQPDLRPLEAASRTVGRVLGRGDVVVFESTVYPGATEEVCVPIMESESGLACNRDFYAGYSPERINPGDRDHRLPGIVKVVSGSTPEAAELVAGLYGRIIPAGVHRASSIRVAEAAKVIENTQRDVNIALVNELAMIFHRLGIDTREVLDAAGTKWNFLPFVPGLVGGHCIGVDPYYLTAKAQEIGYFPEMILAGRRLNDRMGGYVAERVVKLLTQRRIHVAGAAVLVMGFTFKENCPDLRNTRVIDMIREFQHYQAIVEIFDPWVDTAEAEREYGVRPVLDPPEGGYDAVILAVAHRQFIEMGPGRIRALCKPDGIVFDIKNVLPAEAVDGRL